MEKLTLENIACYLPHKLVVKTGSEKVHNLRYDEVDGIRYINDPTLSCGFTANGNTWVGRLTECPMVLRPMSDYTNINGKAMLELNCDLTHQMEIRDLANGIMGYWNISHGAVHVMQKNLIDYQGLIEKGLAIDANTLKTNPYNN